MISIARRDLVDLVDSCAAAIHRHASLRVSGRAVILVGEPSTRTRVSTELAARELGLSTSVVSFDDAMSLAKGESFDDTFQVLGSMSEILAIRSPRAGIAKLAYAKSGVPVLNLGDGGGEHPSQGLSTLVALRSICDIHDASVVIGGDLARARTIRSVAMGVLLCGGRLTLVGPNEFAHHLVLSMKHMGVTGDVQVVESWKNAPDSNLCYFTRIQNERWNADELPLLPIPSLGDLKRHELVLHPLPRGKEVGDDAWDVFGEQILAHVARTYAVRKWLMYSLVTGGVSSVG